MAKKQVNQKHIYETKLKVWSKVWLEVRWQYSPGMCAFALSCYLSVRVFKLGKTCLCY